MLRHKICTLQIFFVNEKKYLGEITKKTKQNKKQTNNKKQTKKPIKQKI